MTACVQTSAPCELLPWDSDFFQCRIGRVRGDVLDRAQAEAIAEWSRAERVRCLYFLARADCPGTVETAQANGFGLVDIRVTLQRPLGGPQDPRRFQPSSDVVIRPFRADDLPTLEALAEACHTDTRFFSDPHFPRPAKALYSTWIRRDCQGRAQQVLVADTGARPALGYVSCQVHSAADAGQIGLLGVSPEARGKGLAKSLVQSALGWLEAQGAREVTVVTQGRNVPAQRLYQGCGFRTRDVRLWYHKWFPEGRGEHA